MRGGHLLRRQHEGRGRIYQQTFIDTYAKVVFAKLYDRKTPVTAEILNDRVLPFFEENGIVLCRMLTDRGTEYCGNPEHHYYEPYLAVEDIDHSRTKAKSPQTNGSRQVKCILLHTTTTEVAGHTSPAEAAIQETRSLALEARSVSHDDRELARRRAAEHRAQARAIDPTIFSDKQHSTVQRQLRSFRQKVTETIVASMSAQPIAPAGMRSGPVDGAACNDHSAPPHGVPPGSRPHQCRSGDHP